jgi:hypothetical protein
VEAGPPDPLRELAAQDPLAAALLEILANLASRPIPLELIDAALPGTSPEARAAALGVLAATGTAQVGEGTVTVPGELAAALRGALPEELARGARRAAELLLAFFPEDGADPAGWAEAGRLLPHVRQLADLRGLELESAPLAELLARAAEYSRVRGDLAGAERLAKRALVCCPPDSDTRLVAALDYTLGRALASRGYLSEAGEWLELAHEVWASEEEPAPGQRRLAALALAEVKGEMGELEAALALAGEARSVGEPDRLDAIALRRLAWVAMESDELDQARQGYEDALSHTEALLGAGHPDLAEARAELGALLVEEHRWEEAAAQLEAALELAARLLGGRHPLVGVIRSNLAAALEGLDELPRARAEVIEALSIGSERLPPAHRSLWLRHRKLRRILRALGDPVEAREHADAAARLSGEVLGAGHPEHAEDLLSLAELLVEEAEMADAAAALEEAVGVFLSAPGDHREQLATARRRLGAAKVSLGMSGEALAVLRVALVDFEELGDEEGAVDVRAELADLVGVLGEEQAQTLEVLGRPEDAEAARRAAGERRFAVLSGLVAEAGPGECFTIAAATRESVPEVARLALTKAGEIAAAQDDPEKVAWARLLVGLGWQSYAAARRVADPEDASVALESARSLVAGNLEEEAGVLLDLAELAGEREDPEALEQNFEAAVELYREAGGGFDLGYALLLWGRARFARGDHDGAEALLAERLGLLAELPEPEPRAIGITWHDLGNVRRERGEGPEAIEAYRAAVAAKREAEATDELALTLVVLGDALTEEAEEAEALSCFEEALALLGSQERPGRLDRERVLLRIADLHASAGEPGQAAAFFGEAAELARASGDHRHLAVILSQLGRALQTQEDFAGAEQIYRERLGLLRGLAEREPRAEGIALHDLGEVLRAQAEFGQAAEVLAEAAAVASAAGELDGAAFSLLSLAQTQEQAEEPGAAAATYGERLELLRALPERRPRAEAANIRKLGELAEARGEGESALALHQEAVRTFREGSDPPTLAGALVGLAMLRTRLARTISEAPSAALLDPSAAPERTRAWIDQETASLVVAELSEALALAPDLDPLSRAALRVLIVVAGESLPDFPAERELRAAASAEVAAVIDEEDGDPDAERLQMACSAAGQLGRFDLARRGLARLRARPGEEAGELLDETLARLGRFAERVGELEQAAAFHGQRLEALRAAREPEPIAEGVALADLGDVARRQGDLGLAAERYREAATVRHEAGRLVGEGRVLYWLSLVLRADRKFDQAAEAAAEALGRFEEAEAVGAIWPARALLAEASVRDGSAREELIARAEELLGEFGPDEDAAGLAEVIAAIRGGAPVAPGA